MACNTKSDSPITEAAARRVLSINDEWLTSLIDGVSDILPRLDLVVEDEDASTITGFKTSRGRWSAGDGETSPG